MTEPMKPRPRGPAEERFWRHVEKTDGCWNWLAAKTKAGYGQFSIGYANQVFAHRFAYELMIGPIPKGMEIDHLCFNRGCVKPVHMEVVTREVNIARSSLGRNEKGQFYGRHNGGLENTPVLGSKSSEPSKTQL